MLWASKPPSTAATSAARGGGEGGRSAVGKGDRLCSRQRSGRAPGPPAKPLCAHPNPPGWCAPTPACPAVPAVPPTPPTPATQALLTLLVLVVPAALVVAQRKHLGQRGAAGEGSKLARHVGRAGPHKHKEVKHAALGDPLRGGAALALRHVHIHLRGVQPVREGGGGAQDQGGRQVRGRGGAASGTGQLGGLQPGTTDDSVHDHRQAMLVAPTRRRRWSAPRGGPAAGVWSRTGQRASRAGTQTRPGCTGGTGLRAGGRGKVEAGRRGRWKGEAQRGVGRARGQRAPHEAAQPAAELALPGFTAPT